MVKVVAISDTHLREPTIPDGDILIHSGDALLSGSKVELELFIDWFEKLPHQYKVLVAGNHDKCLEYAPAGFEQRCQDLGVTYLRDNCEVIQGLLIYGSPWQPWFNDWAFNIPRGSDRLYQKWQNIPMGLDILITHGPPMYILDRSSEGLNVGCELLRDRVEKVKPRFHVFGHVHEGYGVVEKPDTTFINASICDLRYRPVNKPVEFEL